MMEGWSKMSADQNKYLADWMEGWQRMTAESSNHLPKSNPGNQPRSSAK